MTHRRRVMLLIYLAGATQPEVVTVAMAVQCVNNQKVGSKLASCSACSNTFLKVTVADKSKS